jgi:tetratricopeptide (TPR) repeat protein
MAAWSRWYRNSTAFALAAALSLASGAALADPDATLAAASREVQATAGSLGAIQAAMQSSQGRSESAPQRLADAELLLGAKDYERAIQVTSEVIERFPANAAAQADARALLGEAYFRDRQYLSARRTFLELVDQGATAPFGRHQPKALSRLVDVALRTRQLELLDPVLAALARSQGSGSLVAYARGKALFAKGDLGGARAALSAVEASSEVAHQAQYLLGLAAVREATPPDAPKDTTQPGAAPPKVPASRYAGAIEQFRRVTQLPVRSEDERHVADLAWLAIGRLQYESEQFPEAATAYARVGRDSPEFGVMLYELGWVYVRLGDVDRALRTLEVLAVAEPNSSNIADGSLLRADLMLRAGQFDKALKVYEGVRVSYDPVRERVQAFLGSTNDPAVFYDKLSRDELESGGEGTGLPTFAVEWAREEQDGPVAFAVLDEVKLCRDLIKRSNDLIERLNSVLGSSNRVRAFPELKAGEEKALSLSNRLALARLSVGRALDEASAELALGGEIGSVRARRRALEKRLGMIPVTEGDFQERENQALRQWNTISQAAQRMTLEVDAAQAAINGLRRMLREGSAGVARDPAAVARFEQELSANERELSFHRQSIEDLRRAVRMGKAQVGFGDQRFVEDEQVRREYRDAIQREVTLAGQGQGGPALVALASRATPVLQAAGAADDRIDAAMRELQSEVERKAGTARNVVLSETANVVRYGIRLDELDQEARLLVGQVAMRNFGLVRNRLRDIVLRADVGVVQEAWEVREEQLTRVRSLKKERAREQQLLDEELKEVLDDSGEPEESK